MAAVGVGELEGGVGEELDVPAGAVGLAVVAAAEQHEVVEAVGPSCVPFADVVGVGPGGGAVAAGPAAALVAGDDGVVEVDGGGAGGAAVVEDGGASVDEEAVQGAVAGQDAELGG